jgi:glycosyltransferase involved in cell wall biosynthesis
MVILSVSNWLNHIVEQSFFKDTPKQTIYNGLDTDLFKPTENAVVIKNSYKVDNCFMLLGVAYPWGRKKGFSDFLKLSKYLNPDERIVLVGLNDNELKMLPENIIGLRKTENKQQLVDLYNATDIFLNLSIEETFGLTTAEAMSCGTPVILYNATACPEIIDTETGIAIEKSDINSLVKAISIIRAKGKKFYSIKCRERVLNNFDKKEKNQEYLNLFERLLK